MKTITLDFETYQKELEASESRGTSHGLVNMLRILRGEDRVQNIFFASDNSSWREIDIKNTAQKILELFEAQKEKS